MLATSFSTRTEDFLQLKDALQPLQLPTSQYLGRIVKMQFSLALLGLDLAAHVQSIAVPRSHVLHEQRDVLLPSQWVKREKLSSNTILPMRIGLRQRNLENSYAFLMDVSRPDSKNYGKHWSSEQVIETFAPELETVETVKAWLTEFGIGTDRLTHSDDRGWIAFDATAEEANALIATQFYRFEHASSGLEVTGCDSYHVPKNVQKHIDYITPGVKLFAPLESKSKSKRGFGIGKGAKSLPTLKVIEPHDFPLTAAGPLANCDVWITPACIRALYNIPEAPEYPNGVPREDNSMGIFETADYYSQKDMNMFFSNFTPNIPQNTAPVPAFIDGAVAPNGFEGDGGETITLYQTDDLYCATDSDSPATGSFNTFLDAIDGSYCTYSAYGETGNDSTDPVYPDTSGAPGAYEGQLMCGVYKPTNVISISYGGQEIDMPVYYQKRQCNEFLKLGLQGVSIFFASGDSGVAGPPNFGIAGPNGCLGRNATIFNPTWPNKQAISRLCTCGTLTLISCPYITNVGATKVNANRTVYQPESAVVDPAGHPYRTAFSSGGGFSNIYTVPDYQKDAIGNYFDNHDPKYVYYTGNNSLGKNGGVYNRNGRGIPDVAANGDNIATFYSGRLAHSGGTSASTPIFASIVNRINEQRLNAGKSTVGFINPALYLHPEILNDITNGTNPGCHSDGFLAVPGWDPVTGLGTPNYPKMLEFFMGLP